MTITAAETHYVRFYEDTESLAGGVLLDVHNVECECGWESAGHTSEVEAHARGAEHLRHARSI